MDSAATFVGCLTIFHLRRGDGERGRSSRSIGCCVGGFTVEHGPILALLACVARGQRPERAWDLAATDTVPGESELAPRRARGRGRAPAPTSPCSAVPGRSPQSELFEGCCSTGPRYPTVDTGVRTFGHPTHHSRRLYSRNVAPTQLQEWCFHEAKTQIPWKEHKREAH